MVVKVGLYVCNICDVAMLIFFLVVMVLLKSLSFWKTGMVLKINWQCNASDMINTNQMQRGFKANVIDHSQLIPVHIAIIITQKVLLQIPKEVATELPHMMWFE